MRPRGDFSRELHAAALQGPGTVTELAHRAQVGLRVARYTASRMLARGDLVPLTEGRPVVLGAAAAGQAPAPADWLDVLQRRYAAGCKRRGPTAAEGRSQQFAHL